MSNAIRGWHFVTDDLILRDGGMAVPCEVVNHVSRCVLDALTYAPGSMLERVELSGTIIRRGDKYAVSARTTLLAVRDVSRELRLFACDCAERALARVTAPNSRSITAVAVARRYAEGQATEEELDAAWRAADAAAFRAADAVAAWAADTAVWVSARAAAWDATRAAATAAATHAARRVAFAAAASSAAWDAAWDAERAWQRDELERRMLALFEGGEG